MSPLFKPGDVLYHMSCAPGQLCTGDIILFKRPGSTEMVAHRITGLSLAGIKTSGDANMSGPDPWLLTYEKVTGRVIAVRHINAIKPVNGGLWGRFYAKKVKLVKRSKNIVSTVLHPLYYWLARSGIIRIITSPFLKIKILKVRSSSGDKHILMLHKQVIGSRGPNTGHWIIRPPFRLLVNELELNQLST